MRSIRPGSSGRGSLSRRDFARLLSFGGSAALIAHPAFARLARDARRTASGSVTAPSGPDDERAWTAVRSEFLMPTDLHLFNAANLCPSPRPVLDALSEHTRRIDATPSPAVRESMHRVKEATRRTMAAYLRVTPDEIVITRNTSEGNNFVSSGLDLRAGDEVVILDDNHPSNHAAWREKAKRHGFTVTTLPQPNPHPGADFYIDAVRRAVGSRTKVVAFSHVSNTVGDLLPAKEICAIARERGALSLVDGAQTIGVLDIDLRDMAPDFYTGSAHKWPCGPLEAGVLFVDQRVQSRLWPSVISLYGGQTGISRTMEGLGQRDEPAILALGEAVEFHQRLGGRAIETRARALAAQLAEGLRAIEGITMWTSPHASRATSIVSFRPGALDPTPLAARLFDRHGIVCAVRAGDDRGGLRFAPHIYNTRDEIELAVAAIREAMRGRA